MNGPDRLIDRSRSHCEEEAATAQWRQHYQSWSESKLKSWNEYQNWSTLTFPKTTTSLHRILSQFQSATPKLASRTFFDRMAWTSSYSRKSRPITTTGLSNHEETSLVRLPSIIFAKASSWYTYFLISLVIILTLNLNVLYSRLSPLCFC